MKIAYEQSMEHGPEARKFTVIFDMDNFSMKQYAYRWAVWWQQPQRVLLIDFLDLPLS